MGRKPPAVVDESPLSDFVREMKALLARRMAARGQNGKAAVTQEMRRVMRQHFGRGAWQAMVDAENAEKAIRVPRDTSRDRQGPRRAHTRGAARAGERRYRDGFDIKLAQTGERDDD
jgi:hypothetical protein